jgi:hypothetical protein
LRHRRPQSAQNAAPSARHQTMPEGVHSANSARSWPRRSAHRSWWPASPHAGRGPAAPAPPAGPGQQHRMGQRNCAISAALASAAQGQGTRPRLSLRPKNIATIIASTAAAKTAWQSKPQRQRQRDAPRAGRRSARRAEEGEQARDARIGGKRPSGPPPALSCHSRPLEGPARPQPVPRACDGNGVRRGVLLRRGGLRCRV